MKQTNRMAYKRPLSRRVESDLQRSTLEIDHFLHWKYRQCVLPSIYYIFCQSTIRRAICNPSANITRGNLGRLLTEEIEIGSSFEPDLVSLRKGMQTDKLVVYVDLRGLVTPRI